MQDMSNAVTIYVATMTGTADLVAEEVQAALEEEGAEVDLQPMDDLDAGAFAAPGLYLVVSSTYGQGDVPDNGQALADALERERPDLAHVRYGLFALGDMTYARTFCGGGHDLRPHPERTRRGAGRRADAPQCVIRHPARGRGGGLGAVVV